MAAGDQTLLYKIEARDAQFKRVAERVTKRLERLEKGSARTDRSFRKFGQTLSKFPGIQAALGAAAAAVSLQRLNQRLTESISRLDQLGKRARNIGLDVETLQLWSQAAKEAGVETDSFQRGLLKFNKVLGEAGSGAGEYEEIFERLGVQIKDAEGALRPMPEVLADVQQAFGRLDEATQQLTIEELFGRGGREMRAFFLDFNNQVDAVSKGFRGASAEAAKLGEELQNMRDRGLGNLTAALDEALVRMDRFFSLTKSITDGWNRAAEAIRFAIDHGPFSAAPQTRISTPFAGDAPSTRGPGAGRVPPAVRRRSTPQRFHPGTLPGHLRASPEAAAPARGADNTRAAGSSPAELRRRQTSERFAAIVKLNEEKRQRLIREAQNLENKLAQARRDEYQAEAKRLGDLAEMRKRNAAELASQEQARYEEAQANLTGVVSSFIHNIGDIGGAFKGLLNSFSSAVINQFAGQVAGSLLSGGGGGFFASIFGSGLFGSARGGPGRRGQAILVGEGGPEVFVPDSNGTIVPNSATFPGRGGGGGATVNLTFNVESTDGPGVRAAIRAAEPRLTRAALTAVATQQSRPGTGLARQNRRGN